MNLVSVLALFGITQGELEASLEKAAIVGLIDLCQKNILMAAAKVSYWKSQGSEHFVKIDFWEADLKFSQICLTALQGVENKGV